MSTSPSLGRRIEQAWQEGTLLPDVAAGRSGARARRAGVGESFAAWLLELPDAAPLLVRVPWRAPEELSHPLRHEVAALEQLQRARQASTRELTGLVPRVLGLREGAADSPLGAPYVVVSAQPGQILEPAEWTQRHLAAHARALAQLHTVPAPGHGPISRGADPWQQLDRSPRSVRAEAEAVFSTFEREHPELLEQQRLAPLLRAARTRISAVEAEAGPAEHCVISHGDLCATNVLWSGSREEPRPRFIDFEWAQADDPARDLAILGGRVVGGPWYVPFDDAARTEFVRCYVTARDQLQDSRTHSSASREDTTALPHDDAAALPHDVPAALAQDDAETLATRMLAWEAYERTAMMLHLTARDATSEAGAPGPDAAGSRPTGDSGAPEYAASRSRRAQARDTLRRTLDAALDVPNRL